MGAATAQQSLLVILGNQLFAPEHLPPADEVRVAMIEDLGLCTYVRHHQQKIVLFLAAMRAHADRLREAGYEVAYATLDSGSDRRYEDTLADMLDAGGNAAICYFEIEDKAMEARIRKFADDRQLARSELASPMFLCDRKQFSAFAAGKQRLLMADFYKQQRLRHGILIDDDGEPAGGQWSFDEDNRKKLPKSVIPPAIDWPAKAQHVDDVIRLVAGQFAEHPGDAQDFRWPTTRSQAQSWLRQFIDERLENFGPYEDALTTRSETVFHSLLTPVLNLGLITPREIVDAVLKRADDLPLQSVEGFLRQVIGWREFVRGIYREYSEEQDKANFFSHTRELTDAWYSGRTGIPPLDDTIRTAGSLGWAHHIPRLMVLANLMTLTEIRPQNAHRWFMEMFVDSSEWVMGPNVYGMGLYSDGGIFATKPYICGSNYLLKMSDYKKGGWCDIVDGLYWRFIDKHREFFAGNPRLALMPRALDRLKEQRKAAIFAAAEDFLAEFTHDSSE